MRVTGKFMQYYMKLDSIRSTMMMDLIVLKKTSLDKMKEVDYI